MISLETLYNLVIAEKKDKPLSGYDYYKMIRKPTPPTVHAFKIKRSIIVKTNIKIIIEINLSELLVCRFSLYLA
jgi:hypothetical protein